MLAKQGCEPKPDNWTVNRLKLHCKTSKPSFGIYMEEQSPLDPIIGTTSRLTVDEYLYVTGAFYDIVPQLRFNHLLCHPRVPLLVNMLLHKHCSHHLHNLKSTPLQQDTLHRPADHPPDLSRTPTGQDKTSALALPQQHQCLRGGVGTELVIQKPLHCTRTPVTIDIDIYRMILCTIVYAYTVVDHVMTRGPPRVSYRSTLRWPLDECT